MTRELAERVLHVTVDFALTCSGNSYVKHDLDELITDLDESLARTFVTPDEGIGEGFDSEKCIYKAFEVCGITTPSPTPEQ